MEILGHAEQVGTLPAIFLKSTGVQALSKINNCTIYVNNWDFHEINIFDFSKTPGCQVLSRKIDTVSFDSLSNVWATQVHMRTPLGIIKNSWCTSVERNYRNSVNLIRRRSRVYFFKPCVSSSKYSTKTPVLGSRLRPRGSEVPGFMEEFVLTREPYPFWEQQSRQTLG